MTIVHKPKNKHRLVIHFENTKRCNNFKTTKTYYNVQDIDKACEIIKNQDGDIASAFWNNQQII